MFFYPLSNVGATHLSVVANIYGYAILGISADGTISILVILIHLLWAVIWYNEKYDKGVMS